MLRITRVFDGRATTPIRFTDTLLVDQQQIVCYEINLDPTPIGELFAP